MSVLSPTVAAIGADQMSRLYFVISLMLIKGEQQEAVEALIDLPGSYHADSSQ